MPVDFSDQGRLNLLKDLLDAEIMIDIKHRHFDGRALNLNRRNYEDFEQTIYKKRTLPVRHILEVGR